uniref:KICSTOR subunit 2 isoform X2 n=1 Tax=Myxine glutinosa TaxID=7769 RepID=UPI00358F4B2D
MLAVPGQAFWRRLDSWPRPRRPIMPWAFWGVNPVCHRIRRKGPCTFHLCDAVGGVAGGQSFFARKDSIRNSYSTLAADLNRFSTQGSGATLPLLEELLFHLAGQLDAFVRARQEMADFYERLYSLSLGRNCSLEDLPCALDAIVQKVSSRFHHPTLSGLNSSFQLEVEILAHLLQAQLQISSWLFFPSLMNLHASHTKLAAWTAQGTEHAREAVQRKPLFGGSTQRGLQPPHLHQWLSKFKMILLAKFTLYFHEILSQQTTSEMKTLTAKVTPDLYGKTCSFIKKTDAVNVLLILDITGPQDSFKGHGYHHPSSVGNKGAFESCVTVVSLPTERSSPHWAVVSAMLVERAKELASLERVIYTYNEATQSCYYLVRPEPRFAIVAIFESRKLERDSHVQTFLLEMCASLRPCKPYASLKPGSKH